MPPSPEGGLDQFVEPMGIVEQEKTKLTGEAPEQRRRERREKLDEKQAIQNAEQAIKLMTKKIEKILKLGDAGVVFLHVYDLLPDPTQWNDSLTREKLAQKLRVGNFGYLGGMADNSVQKLFKPYREEQNMEIYTAPTSIPGLSCAVMIDRSDPHYASNRFTSTHSSFLRPRLTEQGKHSETYFYVPPEK